MVANRSALGRSGVQDWLFLRMSAVILALYFVCLIGFIVITPDMTYPIWREYFASYFMKAFTLLALLAVVMHSWIGIWQVLTDYVKSVGFRLVLQFSVIIVVLFYFFYGAVVVWGA